MFKMKFMCIQCRLRGFSQNKLTWWFLINPGSITSIRIGYHWILFCEKHLIKIKAEACNGGHESLWFRLNLRLNYSILRKFSDWEYFAQSHTMLWIIIIHQKRAERQTAPLVLWFSDDHRNLICSLPKQTQNVAMGDEHKFPCGGPIHNQQSIFGSAPRPLCVRKPNKMKIKFEHYRITVSFDIGLWAVGGEGRIQWESTWEKFISGTCRLGMIY